MAVEQPGLGCGLSFRLLENQRGDDGLQRIFLVPGLVVQIDLVEVATFGKVDAAVPGGLAPVGASGQDDVDLLSGELFLLVLGCGVAARIVGFGFGAGIEVDVVILERGVLGFVLGTDTRLVDVDDHVGFGTILGGLLQARLGTVVRAEFPALGQAEDRLFLEVLLGSHRPRILFLLRRAAGILILFRSAGPLGRGSSGRSIGLAVSAGRRTAGHVSASPLILTVRRLPHPVGSLPLAVGRLFRFTRVGLGRSRRILLNLIVSVLGPVFANDTAVLRSQSEDQAKNLHPARDLGAFAEIDLHGSTPMLASVCRLKASLGASW